MTPSDENPFPAPKERAAIWRFDHVNVSIGSGHALRALFEGVMGLDTGPRPPFPFPGRWLYEGDQAMVHAVDDPNLSAPGGEVHFGHIAFTSRQPASGVIDRLRATGLPFKIARVPADNVAQIFVQLPGHFVVELDVPDDIEGPPTHVYSATRSAPTAEDF